MTKEDFDAKALRAAERAIGVPPGWWGTWRDVRGPLGQRVYFSSGAWVVARSSISFPGRWLRRSRHDSRSFAIGKARKL